MAKFHGCFFCALRAFENRAGKLFFGFNPSSTRLPLVLCQKRLNTDGLGAETTSKNESEQDAHAQRLPYPYRRQSQPKLSLAKKTTTESKPFIGQWNTLVSTTNWDKGQIICQWRKQLEVEGVKSNEYSDEAWSQLVGGVTPQHVGRLRRCFDRFGHVFNEYEGILEPLLCGAGLGRCRNVARRCGPE